MKGMIVNMKLDRNSIEDIIGLTPIQEGMLFHYLYNRDSEQYFEQLSISLEGNINVDKIREAWNFVINANSMLRTIFRWDNIEKPIQIILKSKPVQITEHDFSYEEKNVQESLLNKTKENDRKSKIDIGLEPFRISLCKLCENEFEMILSYHHIILDGWSTAIIIKEFFDFYISLIEDTKPEFIKKSEFKEYVKWLEKQDKVRNIQYWGNYLLGFEEKTQLLVENIKKDGEYLGKKYECFLSESFTQEATHFCIEHRINLATLLNVTWGILLQRYSNSNDVVFGTTVSGRTPEIKGIENIVGLFINTIPFRIKADGDEKVVDLLKKIDADFTGNFEFQAASLVDIKACTKLSKQEEIFNSIVIIQNYPLDIDLNKLDGKLKVKQHSIFETTNYDLNLEITITNDIKLNFMYNGNRISSDAIYRISKHYGNILNIIVEKGNIGLDEIDILSNEEKNQILYEFNSTKAEYPKDKTVHQLFEETVDRTPDKVAVVCEEKQLTYRELNERANQLAHLLREKGVTRDSIVGLWTERSLEMIVGIMGILKAGGAYLPIDTNYPQDRIEYILEDSGAKLLLTQSLLSKKAVFRQEIILLDDESLYEGAVKNPEKINQPNDLAYIIYTSGSTGKPKGVMIEHHALINRINWMQKKYPISEQDVVLQKTAYTFDVSVWELLWWSQVGATLCMLVPGGEKDPRQIAQAIEKNRVTVMHFVPSMLNIFMEYLQINDVEGLSSLRQVFASGEALIPYQVEKFNAILSNRYGTALANLYGPTEAAIDVSYFDCIGKGQLERVPIGKPIDNINLYILDERKNVQPIGVSGELYIAGVGLARGYLNNTTLTAEKFIDNPFEPGTKMYHTGDLARWLSDGNIEFLGRIDHQVKIRGFRIELGEIETQLLSYQGVNEVIVTAKEDNSGSKYLCVYIVGERDFTVGELRQHLGKELPEYMIPSYFVQLEKLPLTANGKIDRKSLPEPDGSMASGITYEAPTNAIEEKLVTIWQEILKIDKIGIRDNFFELGGHSLKATSMVAKIQKEMEVEILLKEIFQEPTIKEISDKIKEKEKAAYIKIEPVEEKEYYKASSAQKRLYTLQQFDLESTAYNMFGVLELEGKLDVERLKEAFKALMKRHASLRTSFEIVEEELVQKIHQEAVFEIEEITKGFVRAFDLSKAPLFRVGLISYAKEKKATEEKHILMYDMHHIISDGTSIGILVDEFIKLYAGEELQELKVQYIDYCAWQDCMINSEIMQKQEDYWLKEYEEEIPILNLPTDYPRPVIQSFEGDCIYFELEEDITEGLKKIGRETGTTLYMLLLANFNILLSKYTGQEDIVVGSPIAGRPHADLENIIGMFVNTLAIRSNPEGKKTYREYLDEVKEKCLKAYENQDYQFEELIEKLKVRRDMSRNALFDVMLVLQNTEIRELEIEDLRVREYKGENKVAKFDITINAVQLEKKIGLSIEYCTKLFSKDTIERLRKHLVNIIANTIVNQDIKLSAIDMLTAEENQKLLYTFNNTYSEYPRDKTIHELFEAQVENTPDKVAVVFEAKQLTYMELNERANQLARVLLTKGVSKDSIVGIMVERSLEMIIGIMGILKAGGAYLPIDPAYPTDRTEYMLADSQTKLLLTHKGLESKIGDAIERINIDEESLYQGETSNLDKAYDAGSLAYVIYTSGSTGKPKGVMIEHRNVINTLTGLEKAYPVNEEDAYLLKTTYTFDVSVIELFGWFVGKGRLEILPQGKEKDPREITKVIEERSITHINFVPSMLNLWIEELGKETRQQQSKLKYVMAAGEALSSSTTESFYKEEKQARLENIYGPTEITIYATSCAIEKNKLYSNISIGKPMQNVKAYILDKNNKLCPIGVAGELCIAGEGLARGYLNRAELTAEKFIDNPFELGTKMYRTGDLARWLSDGNIEFLGRIDHQVKIRGYRIELGEIETQLLSYQAVKEVIVTAKEDNIGSKYLCAYIVGERDFTIGELRQHLGKELPDYMIPSYFVQMEKLPLTANGKIDRKALPEPDGSMASGITYEAPTNAIEEKLVTIWQEILKIDKIGIRDNFFELGGHSLKATSMVAKINRELEVELLLKEIFQEPTIKELAAAIKEKEKVTYAKIEPVEEKEYYKASSAQKRLYTLQQFDLESISYNMPIVLRLKGSLDKQKLENIFKQLIQRHEALRTSFEIRNEEIVQIVHKEVAFSISDYVYIEAESETVIQESIRGFVKVFDLSKVPLIRVALVKINEKEHVLMIDMHHIISDGVSMGILTKEFAELYGGKELSKLRIQYKDFAEWQNKLFKSGEIKKQEEYWLKTFEGEIPVLNLPTDYQRPSIQSFEGDNLSFELNYELTGKLKQIAKETGSTMYMVLLSACNILLSKYSGQEDIVIGSPIAGRLHADLENIMGMFVNTLAMRSFPAGNKTFKEFLGEVKANSLSSFEGQDYQFEELIDKLSITRDLSRNPLFDVMFSMHNIENKETSIGELKISPYNAENNISKFDMTLTAVESEDNISFNLNYCTRLFGKKTIEKLIKHFTNILEAISDNINQNISEVEMLTKEEKQQLLVEFNNTKADYPKHKTIHELFEEQAQSTPNAVAVVYEDESLTYNSLNERSNQIARILRSKGVKADSIVAIMVERSAEMITGIMGIIKAGGAYLPIDPEYPNDRIAYMLEDSKSNILLTQTHLINKGDFGVDIINLTDNSIYSEDNSNLDNINTENNLVYTIYTSGSTGKPKGVMVEHKNLVNLVYGLKERIYKENKNLKVSMVSPYVFDASVKQIFPSLLLGHTLCIIPEDTRFDGYKLFDYYANNSIDIADGTPTHLKMLTALEKQTKNIGIKQFVIGGEALSTELVEEYYSKYNKNCIINNVYGPTECCDVTTMLSVTSNMEIKSPIVSIGYPISNATVYILDKYSKAVPVGVLGELCISGAGVTRGYLNRAELTAEKFVDNPYDMTQKLYKTGDLVRWTEAGNIEFLGRIDHQVKIRGFRIELGEIEARLLSYEGIEEAIVIAREAEGNKYICAYITGAREFTISELREYLLKELPEYMIPAYFIQLDKLPLTTNGKIDRKALPELNGSVNTGIEYVAPRNEIEEKLAAIWQEVLGIEKVGINHNFFELGGHSLKAINISAKINKELNVSVPLGELFKAPTIKGLAYYVKNTKQSIYSRIEPVEENEYYELSSAQKRMYTLQQLEESSTSYNIPMVMTLVGELDKAKLEKIFNELIQRHEALRTSFEIKNGEPVQIVHKEISFKIEYAEVDKEKAEEIAAGFVKYFDLSKTPLIRVALVKINDEEHILMIDMHHIISDGASMGILTKEFMELYDGKKLAELKIQYKDFTAWQNEIFKSGEIKKQEEYWLKAFGDEIPVLNLPTDYQRPSIQSFEGDNISFELSEELTGKLKQISKEAGSTMFMVLLSAYNILLSKYSGQEDIIVGSPIAGRPHADLQNIMGMFVNTLAMRNYPESSKTFKEFLEEVKANSLLAFENQDYQFEELIDKLSITRDLSRNPLFDTMCSMQNLDLSKDLGEMQIEGFRIKPYELENKVAKFDITLSAVETENNLALNLEYCTKLFDKNTIRRMLEHYINILVAITTNLEISIRDIEILTEKEKQLLLYDFNNTKVEYSKDITIQQLFEEQVEKTPDNIAVISEDKSYTYRELNKKANQLAMILREKGVKSDTIVGILVERSFEMAIAILGTLKAGGAYLPIDPEYPASRKEYILKDGGVKLLLTQTHLLSETTFDGDSIYLNEEASYKGDGENLETVSNIDNIAYIIYTSGSTGKPKGVMITHNNLIAYITAFKKEFAITSQDVILQQNTYCFDAFIEEFFPILTIGGRMVIVKKYDLLDINKLERIIAEKGITLISCSPLLLNEINNMKNINSIHTFISGGDVLKPEYVTNISRDAKIYNTYGPTEATVCATYYRYEDRNIKNIPIGKPISNYKIYILNKDNKPQILGLPGELCIAGDGVVKGYLNREELTAEKFIDNPFVRGERLYKTGDLARWLPDGNIEFIGRIDNQVKIRGYRIELSEIENQIVQCENIKEALVVAKEDKNGNKYICAYIVLENKAVISNTINNVRKSLHETLPEYMTPSYFMQLDKMPMNANGKVDRKALPEPDGSISTGVEYVAPTNEIEEKLVNIWQEVLGIERIGINDNFFELGGHSLKAINIAAKINKELNVLVPLREMFKTPTIKGLADYVKNTKQSIYSSIKVVEEKEYYELSSAQKRIYTLQQFDLSSISYNMPGVLELEGDLDVEQLKTTFIKLIQRHEVLRTSFEVVDGDLVQKVYKQVEFEIEEYETDEDDEIERIVKGFIRVFDLSQTPLLRVGLVKVNISKHILMFDMHHIISDGVSTGILIEEFSKIYAGEELTPLRIQYKDFSEWQNELFRGDSIKAQEEYWLRKFEGEIPVLNLPTDYPRPAVQSFEGATIQFEIDNEQTNKLRQIAKATGSTMYMVLLSTLNILLSKYSGQADIIVGSPIAGRTHADLGNIIGMFVNTLAMRNYPSGEKSFKEFLREVKENALGAYENQDYQFEKLVEKLNVPRDLSRNPVFDVMFVLQNMDMNEVELEELTIRTHKSENKISKFDMTMNAMELENSICISIQYCNRLFNMIKIERMYKHLENIIQAVTENIDIKLSEVEILTEEEKKKILIDFNDTKTDYSKDKTIQQLFEEQVERIPNNVAVIYEEKSLTYRALNERANQLARVLRDKGVGSDNNVSNCIVAIMVERSLEMIIGIMGILKAGGAYLPISPDYPIDRIQYMLEDSQAKLLLTHHGVSSKLQYQIEQVDLDKASLYQGEGENLGKVNASDSLAYIIYTSGSTGKPKGVMIEHKNVLNTLTALQKAYPIKEEDAYLLKTEYTFDVSVTELFGWFVGQGRLEILPQGQEKDPMEITKAIVEKGITHINFVPSMLNLWLEQLTKNCELGRLQYVMAAGEALSSNIVENFYGKVKEAKLENIYGPTEITIYATQYSVRPQEKYDSIPIGKPMQNVKAYILGSNNHLQPVGVPGELCIAGDGLARGYLNRLDLTAEKFVDNPFEHGTRMYRTGDLARWQTYGNIEFLGRIDQQVKIRGYRIELGEIENQLLNHASVKEAVVIAKEDENSDKYLCAYIVGDVALTVKELREYLSKVLPEYMVPSYFVELEKLPLTPNGKVDRKALPEPDGNIAIETEYEAPRNSNEEKLVAIWREVLGVEKIGINDNFFELGGHSLKAVRIVNLIHKRFSIDVKLNSLFMFPTISKFSKFLSNNNISQFKEIVRLAEQEYYELSYSQKRLWLINQIEPDTNAYNLPVNICINEDVDMAVVERVIHKLAERHESMRTYFKVIDENPAQIISKNIEINIKMYDLSTLQDQELMLEKQKIVEELGRPFNLQESPLFRACMLKYGEASFELVCIMHHIISDGWSLDVLGNEFNYLYNSYKHCEDVNLEPLRIQYKDFAAWQNQFITNKEQSENAREYWKRQLAGELPILNLPTSNTLGELGGKKSQGYRAVISEEVKDKLKLLAKQNSVSLFTLLITILNMYLSELTGQQDILIATAGSGRQHDDLKNIMGYFVNTVILRNHVHTEYSLNDLIKVIGNNTVDALEYQYYPIEELVDELKINYPKISVFFNMMNIGQINNLYLDNLNSYNIGETQNAKFDIVFYVKEYANGIELLVVYHSNYYSKLVIENIVNQYIRFIEQVIGNPNTPLSELRQNKKKKKFGKK